jgi:hypothetical protein
VRALAAALVLLAGCAGGPPPPDWQLGASSALRAFEQHYLKGETKLAEIEFARAKDEIRRTGRGELLARAELIRCAARTASLEFDDCPGFAALHDLAGEEERAYAEYLAGRAARAAGQDPLSQLVAAGVGLRTGRVTPAQIAAAVDLASAQGWRRPLLAWLGVQAKRAADTGEQAAAAAIQRRIELILGSQTSVAPAKAGAR